jgi:hypothetical protein
MVIGVFAGGGETELKGMKIFLEKNYPNIFFKRQTPIRNKIGAKPNKIHAHGKTGQTLGQQIVYSIQCSTPNFEFDHFLVIDDLDCHSSDDRKQFFTQLIQREISGINKNIIIGFAKPEIESWLIADWIHTFKIEPDFRNNNVEIRRELITLYSNELRNGSIDLPEDFSFLNIENDSCFNKLSTQLEQIIFKITGIYYSKKDHSGNMLQRVNAQHIAVNCPEFRKLHNSLNYLNSLN